MDQTFQAERTLYTASVEAAQASITLTPVANHAGATILVNGTQVASGSESSSIALAEGQNLISVAVTAQAGTAGFVGLA
ncbi:MAG: cadherin-like beta sandwich domain-containing protein [Candidatus Thiodiazotropha sp.]